MATEYPRPPSWRVDFVFLFEPTRPSSLHGFNTQDDAETAAHKVADISTVQGVKVVKVTKEGKFAPWTYQDTKIK